MTILGAHTINNGGIHMAVRRAGRSGMDTLQVFTAIPKYYNEKVSVRPERVERFREALAETGIAPERVVSHAGYVINVATPDKEKYDKACAALTKELERSTVLGIGAVCFHPGSAGSGNKDDSIARISAAMASALLNVQGNTRLLIENTAGAGNTMGRTAAEVGAMLGGVPAELRRRAGYGLDTCHVFASGYDISQSREQLISILDEFEQACGEAPGFFHLNDSEGALASNRDRHVLIGEGQIGVEPFRWLLQDHRASGVPLILETPQANPNIADDDDSPDPYDVRMIELLRGMSA